MAQVFTGLAAQRWAATQLQDQDMRNAVVEVVVRGLRGEVRVCMAACRTVSELASRQPGYDEALGAANACDELLAVIRQYGAGAELWMLAMHAMAALARSHFGNREALRRRAGWVFIHGSTTIKLPRDPASERGGVW